MECPDSWNTRTIRMAWHKRACYKYHPWKGFMLMKRSVWTKKYLALFFSLWISTHCFQIEPHGFIQVGRFTRRSFYSNITVQNDLVASVVWKLHTFFHHARFDGLCWQLLSGSMSSVDMAHCFHFRGFFRNQNFSHWMLATRICDIARYCKV